MKSCWGECSNSSSIFVWTSLCNVFQYRWLVSSTFRPSTSLNSVSFFWSHRRQHVTLILLTIHARKYRRLKMKSSWTKVIYNFIFICLISLYCIFVLYFKVFFLSYISFIRNLFSFCFEPIRDKNLKFTLLHFYYYCIYIAYNIFVSCHFPPNILSWVMHA